MVVSTAAPQKPPLNGHATNQKRLITNRDKYEINLSEDISKKPTILSLSTFQNSFDKLKMEMDRENSMNPIKCSAIHTLERDMPDFDYMHLVIEVRRRIMKIYQDNPGCFSKLDIEKVEVDDWFVARYLLRQKMDVDLASDMLEKALRFRNESLTNCIRATDFPSVFYKLGGLFNYELDRKGNLMVYMRIKIHRKVPDIQLVLEAFIYFTISWADAQVNGRGISLVFDCSGAGLANADMDTLFALTTMLKNYFPKGLSYILVHELPWVLKPFWYIARMWIPEEYTQLIKFSDASTIYEYVDRDKLPDFMGGTCKRDYCAVPENCTTLHEAVKLWGVHPKLAKKIIKKFEQYLPLEWFQENLDALEQIIDEVDIVKDDEDYVEAQLEAENNEEDKVKKVKDLEGVGVVSLNKLDINED